MIEVPEGDNQKTGAGPLQWLIEKRGKRSQTDVAVEAGVSQQQYSHIELGRRTPSVKTAKRIAIALGFDWKDFFAG